ncbi:MAG TPA: hypothetical protein VFR24_27580 [Candidatus Angelobacter sp.]|nr:hypothetical protein [Candidatus Angelobacter sp.]
MRTISKYEPFLAGWKPEFGSKPRTKDLKQAEELAKPGSKTAFALAMALRPMGTSQSQIVKVLKLPHRNKIKQLVDTKRVRQTVSDTRPNTIKLEVLH